MRLLTVVVLILIAGAGMAQADTPPKGYGLLLSIREVGSNHTEDALIGLAPGDFDWGFTIDPYTSVHISLPDGREDFRPIGGDSTFSANIWWANNQSGQYELQFIFLDGGDENFLWSLPSIPPKLFLTGDSGAQTYSMPLSLEPFYCYGQGQAELTVDFGSQTVPEPGSLLAICTSLVALVGCRKLRH